MTKSLATGCIKSKKCTKLEKHLLVEKVSIDDEISHLFAFDIFFGLNKCGERKLMYNEIHKK